jgi:hypothetical protein
VASVEDRRSPDLFTRILNAHLFPRMAVLCFLIFQSLGQNLKKCVYVSSSIEKENILRIGDKKNVCLCFIYRYILSQNLKYKTNIKTWENNKFLMQRHYNLSSSVNATDFFRLNSNLKLCNTYRCTVHMHHFKKKYSYYVFRGFS